MVEYILLVTLIALFAAGAVGAFGASVRDLFQLVESTFPA